MVLHYLTESELDLSREDVNILVARKMQEFFLLKKGTMGDVHRLLDDVREHEKYLIREKWRELQLKKLDEMKQSFIDMDSLYAELKKIPWYHFFERKVQKQKIEELRIKRRGW